MNAFETRSVVCKYECISLTFLQPFYYKVFLITFSLNSNGMTEQACFVLSSIVMRNWRAALTDKISKFCLFSSTFFTTSLITESPSSLSLWKLETSPKRYDYCCSKFNVSVLRGVNFPHGVFMIDHVTRVVFARVAGFRRLRSCAEVESASRPTRSTQIPIVTSNAPPTFVRSVCPKTPLRTLLWSHVSSVAWTLFQRFLFF